MTYKSEAARRMGRNKKLGNAGEEQAKAALRRIGVLMVEEIGTSFVIVNRKPGGWLQGYFKEKVSGDVIGHTEQGIKVLAEVKTIWDRNLQWSDLDSHQPDRLDMNAEKAISLLVWVHHSGIFVMRWPVPGFHNGTGIKPEQAQRLNIERL